MIAPKVPEEPALTQPSIVSGQHPTSDATKDERDGNSAEWWMVWLTGLLLIVAGIQAWYFAKQLRKMDAALRATEDSVREMRSSDERQLRPYIGMGIERVFRLAADAPVHVKIRCNNYGKSPAIRLGYRFSCRVTNGGTDDLEFGEISSNYSEGRFTVFPDNADSPRMLDIFALKKISADEFDRVGRGGEVILLCFEVEYFDFFRKEPYTTRECFQIWNGGHSTMTEGSRIT